MSELLAILPRRNLRLQLLTTASAILLAASQNATGVAYASDGRPTVWIDLDGQFDWNSGGIKGIPLMALPDAVSGKPFPTSLGKMPVIGFDAGGALTFMPSGSDWSFEASVRYGRAHNGPKMTHNQNYEPGYKYNIHANNAFINTSTRTMESHAVLDFSAGRDFGLGLTAGSQTTLHFGIRFAQFESHTNSHLTYNLYTGVFFGGGTQYMINAKMSRSFRGVGPAISWDTSLPVSGSLTEGVAFDIGANAALLFGRQKTTIATTEQLVKNGPTYQTVSHTPVVRSRQIAAPNLGGFADISFRLPSAKVSFGYRADVFFGVIDGGLATRSTFNRGFYGPFARVSVGIGG